MERLKALQAHLPREQRGALNLIYMNALAELHNHGAKLGCDYRALTPPERTAFVRRVGKTALRDRCLIRSGDRLGASACITGAAVLPHMIALELADWLEELRETVVQTQKTPVLLLQDRNSEVFSGLLRDISAFFPEMELTAELRSRSEDI